MNRKELIASTDATVDRVSVPLGLGDLKDFSIQVKFSDGGGDIVGTLKLEATNDITGTLDWVDVDSSSQAIATSSSHMWNVTNANYSQVRVNWDFTSGTGNIQALGVLKEYPVREGA